MCANNTFADFPFVDRSYYAIQVLTPYVVFPRAFELTGLFTAGTKRGGYSKQLGRFQ